MNVLPWIAALAVASAPVERPNVLFVISDDLNCDLGCYGHSAVRSPHIDALAQSGVRFDRAYVQYPVCNPSRTSFLTGLRPETTGITDNGTHFRKRRPGTVTLPQLFRMNGYFTAGLGKVFHRGLSPDETRPEMDDGPSFDHVFYGKATPIGNTGAGRNLTGDKLPWCQWRAAEGTDADQADGQIADEAVRLLGQPRERPFFLAVGFYRPHDPFQVPKRYFDPYPLDSLAVPQSPAGYRVPFPHCLGGGAFPQAFDKFTDADKREFLRSYYAGVSFIDAQFGRVMGALERNKLTENTVVVFIGDHGYELGARNWWNKNTLFERSCRTPLIVRVPGAMGNGRATAALTEFIDIYPTLAELCGLKGVPADLEGRSLRQVLDDPALPGKPAARTMVVRGGFKGESVRTADWRYTEWDGGKKGAELYDRRDDPGEWVNRADDPKCAGVIAELRKLLR